MDKKKRAEMEALAADHENWDNHVATPEHTGFVSDEEDKEIDTGLGLQMISLRLSKSLIEQFKELAKLEQIGYQPLMRQVLTDYAKQNEYKLVELLTPAEATEKGDKLLMLALVIKEKILSLEPLSNERIFAEGDYNKALTGANTLFCNAYEKADPVLKRHVKLRMAQVAEILDQELQDFQDKKYGKKRQAG
jgi:hypothetical protein